MDLDTNIKSYVSFHRLKFLDVSFCTPQKIRSHVGNFFYYHFLLDKEFNLNNEEKKIEKDDDNCTIDPSDKSFKWKFLPNLPEIGVKKVKFRLIY